MNIDFSNIENLLQRLDNRDDFHIENLSWIEPLGIALLKLYKMNFPDMKISVRGTSSSIGYINTLLDATSSRKGSYIPLEHFTNEFGNKDEIASNVTKKIIENAHNLSDDDKLDLSKYLQYLISEMMDNVISHSLSPIGGIVTAQYYPTKKKVQVVIIDSGVGLLKTLAKKYPVQSEKDAIIKAMEKEVSGSNAFAPYTNIPKHAGLGLYFLSRIIEYTSGKLLIVSNDTVYRSTGNRFHTLNTAFHGTMIAFEIFEERLDYEFGQLFNIIKAEGEEEEEEDIF